MVNCSVYACLNFVLLSIIYGSAFAATNEGLKHFSPEMMQVFRMCFGFALCVIILFIRLCVQDNYKQKIFESFKDGVWSFIHMMIGGFMNIGVSHCLVAIGQQWISSSFVQVLMPFAAASGAVVGHFLLPDEKLTFIKVISIILSFSGSAMASVPNFIGYSSTNASTIHMIIGFVLIIIAMIMFGVAAVYFKRFVNYADVTISACIQTSTSAIVCFIYAIIQNGWSDIESRTMNAKPIAFLWPMLTGCISSGLGVHMFMILIDQLDAFGSNFITFGQMIVGLVIGVAILGDWKGYNWWMILLNIAGFFIVIIGMALGFVGEDEKKKQTEEDNVDQTCTEANSESEQECYYKDVYPSFTQRKNANECPS